MLRSTGGAIVPAGASTSTAPVPDPAISPRAASARDGPTLRFPDVRCRFVRSARLGRSGAAGSIAVVSQGQPADEEAPAGCSGWLLGCAGTVLAIIAMAVAGFHFPAGLPDVYGDLLRSGHDSGVGEFVVLTFALIASMLAALSAAVFARWLAERVRAGPARADHIADATAAVVTVAYFVALGFAGDSWAVLAASTYVGVFAFLLAYAAINRLRR